jgi:hypothetical protein
VLIIVTRFLINEICGCSKKTLILNLLWNLLKTIPTANWKVLTHIQRLNMCGMNSHFPECHRWLTPSPPTLVTCWPYVMGGCRPGFEERLPPRGSPPPPHTYARRHTNFSFIMGAIGCLQKVEPGHGELNACWLDSHAASKSRPACCLKHLPHKPRGNDQIERIPRATLVSGSREPKVVNTCR